MSTFSTVSGVAPCSLSPFWRSPFTDLTGGLIDNQLHGRCAAIEMEYMDCLEAYGLDRGLKKCVDYEKDFRECLHMDKQFLRFRAMRIERERQIVEGKLTGDKKYVTPKIDSF